MFFPSGPDHVPPSYPWDPNSDLDHIRENVDNMPPCFEALGYENIISMNLVECPADMPKPNLPQAIHPLFQWSIERWPFPQSEKFWQTYKLGIRLASYLMEQTFVLDFFTKALYAPVLEGAFYDTDGNLVQKRYLSDSIKYDDETRLMTHIALINIIAPLFSIQIPDMDPNSTHDIATYSDIWPVFDKSYGVTAGNGSYMPALPPKDPSGALDFSHWGKYGISIYLNQQFYEYGVTHRYRTPLVNGQWSSKSYHHDPSEDDAFYLRANYVFAMTMMHELAHVVDMLRHCRAYHNPLSLDDPFSHFMVEKGKTPVFFRANAVREEWGFDLELYLTGGLVVQSFVPFTPSGTPRNSNASKDSPSFFLPVFGVLGTTNGWWQSHPERYTAFFPLNMYWVANWFRRENIQEMTKTVKANDIFPAKAKWTNCPFYILDSSYLGFFMLENRKNPLVQLSGKLVTHMDNSDPNANPLDLASRIETEKGQATTKLHSRQGGVQMTMNSSFTGIHPSINASFATANPATLSSSNPAFTTHGHHVGLLASANHLIGATDNQPLHFQNHYLLSGQRYPTVRDGRINEVEDSKEEKEDEDEDMYTSPYVDRDDIMDIDD
jgi:hypothetical protein